MMYRFLSQLYVYVTYFLSPPCCLYCDQNLTVRTAFCTGCSAQIASIVPFDLYLGKHNVIKIFAVSAYKDPLRSLILAKHRSNETEIRFLADFMANSFIIDSLDFDVITYIPLHWTRYASRGFNQAYIIAEKLAQMTGKPIVPFVYRSKKTEFQAKLSLIQREHNVANAFELDEKYIRYIVNKKILIVDDLFTTGSTVKAVSALLLQHQPEHIQVFVACRVVSS